MEVIIPKRTKEEGVDYMDELKPLAKAWLHEARGSDFGLETSVSKHISDMMGLIVLDHQALLILKDAKGRNQFGGMIFGYIYFVTYRILFKPLK